MAKKTITTTRRNPRAGFKANKALSSAQAQIKRYRTKAASIRKQAAAPASSIMSAASITAGGAAGGAVQVYMPQVMGIDSRWIAGAALVAAAAFQGTAKWAPSACLFGSGILAGAAQDFTAELLTADQAGELDTAEG